MEKCENGSIDTSVKSCYKFSHEIPFLSGKE